MKKIFDGLVTLLAQYWNATLAAASLIGIAIFTLIPPLQHYVNIFIFLGANAVVWTLIEIKADLRAKPGEKPTQFGSMRIARPAIVGSIEERLGNTSQSSPLEVYFIGGRLRSMSDLAREVVDDLKSDRRRGHIRIHIYCIAPSYIAQRFLPGGLSRDDQVERNAAYGRTVQSVTEEMRRITGMLNKYSSAVVDVTHYHEDPHFYAYIIGDDCIFWGPYTYSDVSSDFIGPENACFEIGGQASDFQILRSWLSSRALLYSNDQSPIVTPSSDRKFSSEREAPLT